MMFLSKMDKIVSYIVSKMDYKNGCNKRTLLQAKKWRHFATKIVHFLRSLIPVLTKK